MEKKYYEISWVYTDEAQAFNSGAWLDSDELKAVEALLEGYTAVGIIADVFVGQSVKAAQDYAGLVKEIESALGILDKD
jgi:hypothetical protein